ncbi:ABC transporter ATP-binding protein [Streptomyces sp. YIM S03343]
MSADLPLCIDGLDYEIGGRKLLSALELTVQRGESVAVTGPSGSGKSTLLSLVLGLIRAPAGRILVAGQDVMALRGGKLARWRQRHMGMVFQFGELLPELSPVENVALPALLAGENRGQAFSRGEDLLAGLGVPVDGTLTADLSGGERQRTAVARALMSEPSLLLADEPTGALDEHARDQVAEVLLDAPRRRNCGLLLVTHDASVAERADRVLRLSQARLVDASGRGQA